MLRPQRRYALRMAQITVGRRGKELRPCEKMTWRNVTVFIVLIFFFKKILFILFSDRGEGTEKERERNINMWLPFTWPLLGTWPTTQACALDWELKQWPFDSQFSAQSTQPYQPGLFIYFFTVRQLSTLLAQPCLTGKITLFVTLNRSVKINQLWVGKQKFWNLTK